MLTRVVRPLSRRLFSGSFLLLQGGALIGMFFFVRDSPSLSQVKTLLAEFDQELALAKVITLLGIALVLYRSLGVFFSEGRRFHNFSALPLGLAILISGVILLPLEQYASSLGLSLTPSRGDALRVAGVDACLLLCLIYGVLSAIEGVFILVRPASTPSTAPVREKKRPKGTRASSKKGGKGPAVDPRPAVQARAKKTGAKRTR